jgi:hypothetical protein
MEGADVLTAVGGEQPHVLTAGDIPMGASTVPSVLAQFEPVNK